MRLTCCYERTIFLYVQIVRYPIIRNFPLNYIKSNEICLVSIISLKILFDILIIDNKKFSLQF